MKVKFSALPLKKKIIVLAKKAIYLAFPLATITVIAAAALFYSAPASASAVAQPAEQVPVTSLDALSAPVGEVLTLEEPAALIPIIEASDASAAADAEVTAQAQETVAEPAATAAEEVALLKEEAALAAADNFQAELDAFVLSVTNGYAGLVTGVFVPNALSLPILQQPAGSGGHITSQTGTATQFGIAAQFGSIGILAHNYLAGDDFFALAQGDKVFIVYGDGSVEGYLITEIRRFEALQPNSPYSDFLDLDNDNEFYTATDLFYDVYDKADNVIFQTCINQNGSSTWGRLFVTAEPIQSPTASSN